MKTVGERRLPRLIAFATLVGIAAAAFAAGRTTGSDATRDVMTRTRAAGPAPASTGPGPALSALSGVQVTAALRAAVRDEIREVLTEEREAAADASAAGETESASDEPSDESVAAAERGRAVIEAARRARRWRSEDASALQEVMASVTDDERQALLAELIPAINRGEVTPETPGWIF
jgi:hypothetical protein